ncbi:hypothetical protein QBC47DRAFT_370448 [Echria macrotheca]|uniref:N-acetyltransferase domain-containing protein n=1 Tax=Echria macrotheca TaxID=438768 RepID=A0AAJ0BT70_9PEZI|nr:hypothetical protein QBC47DRAFT_370448 [Echria macrotheca]
MTDPNFYVETPRLFLSYLQPTLDAHCDFMVTLYNTPGFIASIGGGPSPIMTREAARKLLAGRFPSEHARNGYGTYLVSLKPSSSSGDKLHDLKNATPIGTVGLMRGEPPDCYDAPDIGFVVLPEHMRKGYTKEAAVGIMDFLEKEGKLDNGVFGFCNPKNEASMGVLRGLGFEYRGDRPLRVFGGELSAVWTRKGMAEDLEGYAL